MKLSGVVSMVLGVGLAVMMNSGCTKGENKYGELTWMADKYKTDKGYLKGEGHNYTEVYEYFFNPIKYKARRIFEIGVDEGASLKMFRDYFPNAAIYGIDIENTSFMDSKRIKTFIADQSDRKKLGKFIDACGGNFDIILDDGGHTMFQQQVSFGYLFKYLKPGGYYIIEDVHTSLYGSKYGADKNGENTTLLMIDNFVRSKKIKSKYMTGEEENYLTLNIRYCNLLWNKFRNGSITCIFKKI